MTTVNVLRAAHVEFRVTDMERTADFYVGLLGFVETARDANRLYLRGYEEWLHHSLVLRRAPSAGGGHIAFRVADPEDLVALAALANAEGLPHRRAKGGGVVSTVPWLSVLRVDRDGGSPAASLGDLAAPQAERARHRTDDRHGTARAPRRVLDGRYRGRAACL